ncbi:hypothetical protein I302_107856 [Kwoniella bestiolae CBS 10118]|uniref:Elongator complex protein 5 n=1 Tax=Kwoniella bestiolae CBS 10118 TaxID=1296100 RepID=A0A1B9FXC8_9TREE|nr:hypothetical protein I302_06404 [Kwoniella bestiolae CBS 10118]OCF23422.1 hypothetical protein I302_06404 [Kwoniella bestiolae CBS 10118]
MPSRSSGDIGPLLNGALDNAQIPHQSLCVISDSTSFSGLNVFKEVLSRGIRRGEETTLISVLHPPEILLPPSSSSMGSKINVVDLTNTINGYSDEDVSIEFIREKIFSAYTSGQIFIDALDILSEDYSASKVLSLIKAILNSIKKVKAPSRLILLLPPNSPISQTLLTPSFHSTLTLLTPHSPPLVEHLSKSYLSPISAIPSPNLWMILENTTKRSTHTDMALKASNEKVEFDPTWSLGGSAIIQVLVRKPTGGIKGISRSLEGVKVLEEGGLKVVQLDELVDLNPLSKPLSAGGGEKTMNTHSELDLPFNLSLTDEQKSKRAQVPLPYAHEGEGASGDLIWEDEEETDDEEI